MSPIARLPGRISISLNENDHNWPHLHVKCPEGIFRIFFHDLRVEVIVGNPVKARKDLDEVRARMGSRLELLHDRWAAKERGEKVLPIP